MDLTDPGQREHWRSRLGEILVGRKVICGPAPLAMSRELVALLDSVGAAEPLLVATGRGAGPIPAPDTAQVVYVDPPPAESLTDEVRRLDRLVRGLPGRVRRHIDEYDPAGEAVWWVGPFVESSPIDGRVVLGGRPPTWEVLEDKLVAGELWHAAGLPQSPYRVVDVDPAALDEASAELDRGQGVVWSGDRRDGLNGGGDFVRWVADEDDRRAALHFFRPRCDRVRVMPYLQGVPCSIHGVVLPDGTAAFRPVELAVLCDRRRRFLHGGQGTFWDPPQADRDEMRRLVRRTGEHLRERVGYRGAFGIDGVLTADGFRPTELNPRMAGGLVNLARTTDLGLFHLLQANLVAGRDPGVSVAELEAWTLPCMDRRRFGQLLAVSTRRVLSEARDLPVAWDDGELHAVEQDGPLVVSVAPSPTGTHALLRLSDPDHSPGDGARVGPITAALHAFLDRVLDTGFGPVTVAPDVRR